MTELVTVENRAGLALVTIDNPPVNATSHALRKALHERLTALRGDDAIRGVVIKCAGRTFVAGADIKELGTVNAPMLRDVIEALDALGKPSVAAIHGTALGGGFELALGCNFRVALAGSSIGLPEVKLGTLPGAGGTIRTTYLAGAGVSLRLAGGGEPMPVETAEQHGLIDRVFPDDLTENALRFLEERLASADLPPPVRDRRPDLPSTDPAELDAIEEELCRKARSAAPKGVAAAVRNAVELPFDEAMRKERMLFEEATASPRSAALRHVFFSERAAAKPSGDVAEARSREVRTVAVVGAGTMGTGIAIAFANAGFRVIVQELDQSALARGMNRVAETYARSAKRGSISEETAEKRRSLISGTVDTGVFAACDLVVEAAFEDMEVKKQVFAALDRVAPAGAILATNTSYLDVNEIAQTTARPEDVVGLHFFSPANVMKLLEIVRGKATAADVVATALEVARRLGKQPVVVGVCRGFVGNRMLMARNPVVSRLLLEGATPEQMDRAFRAFGWPMGPCEMQDLAGLDIGWRNRKSLGVADPLPDRLCGLGRFGQKAGRGWYLYEDGRTAVPDPEIRSLVEEVARDQGVTRRTVSDEEIIERTHAAMVEEGRKILEEGIAARAGDIDVVWIHGYGFPRDLGGPMYWAEHRPAAT